MKKQYGFETKVSGIKRQEDSSMLPANIKK